jgi:SAM-dependent methyltransferase
MDSKNPADEKLKAEVRRKYGEIAKEPNASSCCGMSSTRESSRCCGGNGSTSALDYSFVGEDYRKLPGYQAEADLGLGCGLPTELALIREGDTVLDLGSGAGNDAFVARRAVGEKGRVIGLDMTAEMVERAKANNQKLGFKNVEFILGEIESMPISEALADVVVSNCVLNLVPNKTKAFAEIFRILKPGGHFNVSDIVLMGELPEKIRTQAVLYVGCVSGAIQKKDYLDGLSKAGFIHVKVQKERRVEVPREVLLQHLAAEELAAWEASGTGIFSVTVWGEKPMVEVRGKKSASSSCGCGGCCG